jgi:NodT family efflux transporter outer membrane factor (OMF) lipoprotein
MRHTPCLTAVTLCALVAGCAVGPDFERPAAPTADSLGELPKETVSAPGPQGESQHFVDGQDVAAAWWTLYRSPALNKLVEEALAANADVKAAQAALRAAREQAKAGYGVFLPNIEGSFQAIRQKDPTESVSATAATGAPILNLFTPQVTVSYTLDLLGGNRRAQESLEAQAEAQRFVTEATTVTLTTNLVVAAITEAGLRGQVKATEDIIAVEKSLLAILHRQLALGQVAESDVLAQEAALAQAEQALPPLAKQLDQQRHQLTALLGHLPGSAPSETFALDDLHLPDALPASLPSKLVDQRPDIRMAEANLEAASANVGVAIANRLPQIDLAAGLGSSSTSASTLFAPGNGLWSIGGTLTQPLFDGFALMHKERAARANFEQAAAQYQSTVIAAFQNVADSLTAITNDARALAAAEAAEQAASKSLAVTRRSLELGAVPYLVLLNAEAAELQARNTLVQAQANRLADTAALFQALGGGWWNKETQTAMATP